MKKKIEINKHSEGYTHKRTHKKALQEGFVMQGTDAAAGGDQSFIREAKDPRREDDL